MSNKIFIFVILAIVLQSSLANYVQPGPSVKPTIGEVWPKPFSQKKISNSVYVIDPKLLEFKIVGANCDILEKAIERYKNIISKTTQSLIRNSKPTETSKTLNQITIDLKNNCEKYPHENMDESYQISTKTSRITANTIWGILRALETLSQLITPYKDGKLQILDLDIDDKPRYSYRGIMLDTSRHFIKIDKILTILDGMEFNKLNVFHWHIVDDQSFPYQGSEYPEFAWAAYHPSMIYTKQDVLNIIEYARLRGIRVIPEFDVPGHSASWGVSHPELLTKCYGDYLGQLGPMNPIREESYELFYYFFGEIMSVFPDKSFHIGGDEVDTACWESNQELIDYVNSNNIDYPDLQKIFLERISEILQEERKIPMIWQEAIANANDVKFPNGTIAQVWFDWQETMSKLTKDGYPVVLSECWYLHVLDTGGDWDKFYKCEPENFSGSQEQKKNIRGGEACMWTEVVNDNNVLQRIFPRVSATAERLWSTKDTKIGGNVRKRLEEHTCRMILRDVPAQPANDPGFC